MKKYLKSTGFIVISAGLMIIMQSCPEPKASLPTVTTTNISGITAKSAVSGGEVTNNGGDDVISRGVCWNTDQNPTVSSSKTIDGAGNGPYTSNITGLAGSTTYHVRAYATNSAGTSYGDDISFTTTCSAPVVGAITQPTCAIATGSVALSGLPSAGQWTLTRNPGGITSTGTGPSSTISGLSAGTYTFTVTSSTNCISPASDNIVITVQPTLATAPVVGTITQPSCSVATGSVVLSSLPATGTWTLTRNPGTITSTGTGVSTTVSGLVAGTYTFIVADASGCLSSVSGNVIINAQPTVPSVPVVGTVTQPTCSMATGSVVLSGLPSTGTWTLTKNPGGTTSTGTGVSTTVSGLEAGTYTFTVTDASGCISTASANIVINTAATAPSAPVVGTITQPTCAVATGSVALSGLPSTGTWTLTRTPGGTTYTGTTSSTTISLLSPATYTFTVAVSTGCASVASNNVVITAIAAPSSVTANAASSIASTTATLSGYVNGNGSLTTVTFEYGLTTGYGSSIVASQSPITGNNYVSASVTSLVDHTLYHYRIKAVNCAGTTYSSDMMFTTLCLASMQFSHVAGNVAPVTKTVTYGITHTNLTGSDKCWITQNLGASNQASPATDASEAAAGWYWQFNKKQGYQYITSRLPSTAWITAIDENSSWTLGNDPCYSFFGSGWRIPTQTEWLNVNSTGLWNDFNDAFNSILKIHAAGYLSYTSGALNLRGSYGLYWSSTQYSNTSAYNLGIFSTNSTAGSANNKANGYSIRCLKD